METQPGSGGEGIGRAYVAVSLRSFVSVNDFHGAVTFVNFGDCPWGGYVIISNSHCELS